MTISDQSGTASKPERSYRSWIRAAIGLGALSAITFWVYREGSLLQQMNAWALLWSTLMVLLVNFVNAALLRVTARIYHRELSFRFALYIGALGSLGNATGGLPIGMTLRYAMLRQRIGLTISQITFGLVSVTIAISLSLLLISAVSIVGLEYSLQMKILPAAFFVCGMAATILLLRWMYRHNTLPNLVKPLLINGHIAKLTLLSFVSAILLVANYVVVAYFILPEFSVPAVTFMSASAMLVSIASFLQSVGGVQEIIMGFSASLTGARLIEGVQLALFIRLIAVISSGLTLAWYLMTPGRIDTGSAQTSEHHDAAR